jgi:hypothetical protein
MKTACRAGRRQPFSASGAVAFLEFLVAAAWAWIVAAYILECIAHRLLVSVVAMGAVNVAVVMIVVVIMIAVGAMNMVMLVHRVTPDNIG